MSLPPCFYVSWTSWPLSRPSSNLAPLLFHLLLFILFYLSFYELFCYSRTPLWHSCLVETFTKVDDFEFASMNIYGGGWCVCVCCCVSFFLFVCSDNTQQYCLSLPPWKGSKPPGSMCTRMWLLPNVISLYSTQGEEDSLETRPPAELKNGWLSRIGWIIVVWTIIVSCEQ